MQLVGGGVNTMTGSGSHALECDVQGESERVENAGSIRNGRYIADEMRMLFGDCDFIGTYVPTRPNSIRGTVVTCNVALMQTGHVGLVGSWEAIRMEGP